MTNSSVSGSYVAVVAMLATSDPWPISVIANAPGTERSMRPAGDGPAARACPGAGSPSRQPPLHARLDLQRRVGRDELLEPGEVAARVVRAAESLRVPAPHLALADEQMHLLQHALAVLAQALALDALERLLARGRARRRAQVGPAAEQELLERGDVDAGVALRRRARVAGAVVRGASAGRSDVAVMASPWGLRRSPGAEGGRRRGGSCPGCARGRRRGRPTATRRRAR